MRSRLKAPWTTERTTPSHARDFRLELVERLAPTLGRALQHLFRLARACGRVGLHDLHQRSAGAVVTETDPGDGAEQRTAAARVDHMMVDREALGGDDLGERPPRPMIDAFRRAHADFEPSADAHLNRRLGNRIAVRAEPSLDAVGRAPGREYRLPWRREDARNAHRGRIDLAGDAIDLAHSCLLRCSGI